MPVFTYCGVLILNLTKTQNEKLQSLHIMAENLINQTKCTINNKRKQEACMHFSETMSDQKTQSNSFKIISKSVTIIIKSEIMINVKITCH